MRGHKDLRLLAALAPTCAALALLIPLALPALVFAAPLALFLPGYAIAAAAFAGRDLSAPHRILFGVALSLAVLVLGSLLLNYLGGLHPLSWAILLVLVTLAGCRAAALRRRRAGGAPVRLRLRLGGIEALLLLGALVVGAGAVALANSTAPAERALGFTQLWVLPRAGSGGSEAQVGVRSQQQAPQRYDLRVKVGDDKVVRRSFRLAPGEARLVDVSAPAGAVGRLPVVATLLRHNRPFEVYHRVRGSLVASPPR